MDRLSSRVPYFTVLNDLETQMFPKDEFKNVEGNEIEIYTIQSDDPNNDPYFESDYPFSLNSAVMKSIDNNMTFYVEYLHETQFDLSDPDVEIEFTVNSEDVVLKYMLYIIFKGKYDILNFFLNKYNYSYEFWYILYSHAIQNLLNVTKYSEFVHKPSNAVDSVIKDDSFSLSDNEYFNNLKIITKMISDYFNRNNIVIPDIKEIYDGFSDDIITMLFTQEEPMRINWFKENYPKIFENFLNK